MTPVKGVLTRLWITNGPRRSEGLPVSVKACQARHVYETEGWATLLRFRQELYDGLGLRQDSLFELMDAVLTAPQRSTLVRLSLTTVFRRLWPSTCDALADGSVDVSALRNLFARTLADSAMVDGRPLWVIDGTNWPRPAARASADRTWAYRPLTGWPQNGVVPAGSTNGWWACRRWRAVGCCRWTCNAVDRRPSRRRRWRLSRSLLCVKPKPQTHHAQS